MVCIVVAALAKLRFSTQMLIFIVDNKTNSHLCAQLHHSLNELLSLSFSLQFGKLN